MPKNPSIALNLMQSAIESNLIFMDKKRLLVMVDKCKQTLNKTPLNFDQQQRYDKLNEMLLAKCA